MEENSDEDIWEAPEEQPKALEEPFTGPEAPMEENSDGDILKVEFDPVEDPYDPLDAEMFPPEMFEETWDQGSEESDAGASEEDIFEAQGFEGSDAGASEESYASVQEEEGADSDIELLEEPPLGAQFRY